MLKTGPPHNVDADEIDRTGALRGSRVGVIDDRTCGSRAAAAAASSVDGASAAQRRIARNRHLFFLFFQTENIAKA